jgi:hypothetical protein
MKFLAAELVMIRLRGRDIGQSLDQPTALNC